MILSVDNAIYRSSSSSHKQAAILSKAEMKQARQRGARVAYLKRRIATMERLVVECDRIAADSIGRSGLRKTVPRSKIRQITLIHFTPRPPLRDAII
jgi:hypothetical protein